MGSAFRIFPQIDVADWYVPVEPKKKESPRTLRTEKKKAIKAAKELGYLKLFPSLESQIESADKTDTISIYMCRCRKVC